MNCVKCGGLVMEPGVVYGYAGKVCHGHNENAVHLSPISPVSKPFSESHPTFWLKLRGTEPHSTPDDGIGSVAAIHAYEPFCNYWEQLQRCSVDVAEHKRLEEDFSRLRETKNEREAEVEGLKLQLDEAIFSSGAEVVRLKKELEDVKGERDEISMTVGEEQFALGEVEGERRAMQRVKEAITKLWDGTVTDPMEKVGRHTGYVELESELGLDGISDSSTGGSFVPPSGEDKQDG